MTDFAELNTFLTVVRERGFSRASQKLLRTQPAVSQAVRRLERDLGEELIDRSSRDLSLTDAGLVVLEHARRQERLKKKLLADLEELRNLAAGRLSIGANESSTLYLFRPLRLYRRLYPKIRVQVRRCRSSLIPKQLLDGDLQLGVVSYEPGEKRLVSEVIYTDHLAFIVSPLHRLADRRSVSIQQLGEETFIAHNVVSPYRRLVLHTFQEHGVPLNMQVEMPTLEAIRKWVERNEGVAFLPRMCVESEIARGRLREVAVPELQMERRIRLLYPRRRTLSRASAAFLELLKSERGGKEAADPPSAASPGRRIPKREPPF